MASVKMRQVEKSFGVAKVLHGVSLDIADGEFVILVGPSGCGKSTLLRMVAGLETITGGEILIGGKVVNDVPAKSRDIAMVFQNYALYPHMTVADNMAFSLKLRGAPKSEIETRVKAASAILYGTPPEVRPETSGDSSSRGSQAGSSSSASSTSSLQRRFATSSSSVPDASAMSIACSPVSLSRT